MSPPIEPFIENIRAFCKWVESDKHDYVIARQLVLALMQGIPQLPRHDDSEDDPPDYPRRGYEGWKMDF